MVARYGLTDTAIAKHLRVSRVILSKVFNGRVTLTLDMAVRFEMAFGVSAEKIMAMQIEHDLVGVREHHMQLDIKRLPEPDQGLPHYRHRN
ncbi:HigA family addiction module antitoxin [Sphingomonas piscis]|uniref:HigA family addiction module antitoxin n=1 Tax=Sphingomonas piscis TaxID=2714943 RepID=UPI001FEA2640|nr:HigA family addiction module antitoxin [Sphingomonas piscis]